MKGGLHFFFPEEDLSKVFAKREVKPVKNKPVAVSQLSRQLEESRGKPNNPFLEYSKFEGEVRRVITFKVVIVTSIRGHILCVFIKKLFSWNRSQFFFSGFPRNLYQKTQDIFNYAARGIHDQYKLKLKIESLLSHKINNHISYVTTFKRRYIYKLQRL